MSPRGKKRKARPKEIFLSHSHHDEALARRLAKELRRHRIKVWYSEHYIQGAQQWQDEIGAALDRCDWFIVIVTRSSVESKWVKREVSAVLDDDRYEGRVVPLLAEQCKYGNL